MATTEQDGVTDKATVGEEHEHSTALEALEDTTTKISAEGSAGQQHAARLGHFVCAPYEKKPETVAPPCHSEAIFSELLAWEGGRHARFCLLPSLHSDEGGASTTPCRGCYQQARAPSSSLRRDRERGLGVVAIHLYPARSSLSERTRPINLSHERPGLNGGNGPALHPVYSAFSKW